MKISQFIHVAVILLALCACQSDNRDSARNADENGDKQVPPKQESPVKLLEYLVGEWQLQTGGHAGQQTATGERLTFTDEARYVAYSGNQKVDSGAYRMNEQLRNLYLESEVNKKPREYELDLKQDVMTLIPREQEGQGGSLTYRRVGS